MTAVLEVLAWGLTLGGLLIILIGAVGVLRLPDVFTRLHAAGLIDTLGAGLLLFGMAVHVVMGMIEGDVHLWTVLVRLVLIYAFLLFTSPIGTHALSRAALDGGLQPWRAKPAATASAGQSPHTQSPASDESGERA